MVSRRGAGRARLFGAACIVVAGSIALIAVALMIAAKQKGREASEKDAIALPAGTSTPVTQLVPLKPPRLILQTPVHHWPERMASVLSEGRLV